MTEYWKSIPKYFCKYCNKFVTDTKLGRREHEATFKHQNAIKKFMDDIHRRNQNGIVNNVAKKAPKSDSTLAPYERKVVRKEPIKQTAKKIHTLDDWQLTTPVNETDSIPTQISEAEQKSTNSESCSQNSKSFELSQPSLKRNREIVRETDFNELSKYKVQEKKAPEIEQLGKNESANDLGKPVLFKKRKSARENIKRKTA
ncbi:WW domain-binding protein 4 [Schizosaccharomyces japonicus yFS275]|uniref:WW domain-binding protein 4 n=1 Tax=Schizosaccharomyces japonicus (strain yFS275 / FY16936) TaxID=402676 RepID=B6K477_SCHJY|nr:WW domain-binding protein 4 [Schizosaccharomyces japonicus yFS275]EEB08284.1 WW domain-binding protein 4 [Schizosaccharomyces japonicus yFS275]